MNVFTAIGRVGRDAVTRYTQGGKAVTGWALAIDKGWGDNKQTIWLDCSLWGERGGKLAEHIMKGAQIGVSGELGTREHDGKTYVTLDVREVTLVGGRKKASEPHQQHGGSKPAKAPSQPQPDDDFDSDIIPF